MPYHKGVFMKIKLIIYITISILVFTLTIILINVFKKENDIYIEGDTRLVAKTQGKTFQVYHQGKFKSSFLTGVNIGATKPGHFPGELAITKEEYLRWFEQIHAMNSDVIRVYTTMMPHFYEALAEFNKGQKRPLYLMQGLWMNEDISKSLGQAYGNEAELLNALIKDGKDLVDIFHGNAVLEHQYGFASGIYETDVSKYVIGWILGVEWDPTFVQQTNLLNPNKVEYAGNFIKTAPNASPFEVFLTSFGDQILSYEMEKYQMMRPISFTNWLTTDLLTHPNEPDQNEDMVSVNTENILSTDAYISGIFAAYHVYPYYPEFMNYSIEYRNYIDDENKVNPYLGYLLDLIDAHSVPVMVAEFGIPSSRGKAHDAIHSGFNQGFMTEEQQGHAISSMIRDIKKAGFIGGLVFAWQDEWFKRTWNTLDFDLSLRRPFWSNIQTNEQMFGLLAFEPGLNRRVSYADGVYDEWDDVIPLFQDTSLSLSILYDERYLYLYIDTLDFDIDHDTLWIPILTLPDQGNLFVKDSDLSFSHATDFLIKIRGKTSSRIMVDAYYDSFYYLYGDQLNLIDRNPDFTVINSGIFNQMHLALSAELYLPQDDITIPFSSYETGLLRYGNANPSHSDYDSLADFYSKDGKIEIQIPWALLNISDPSTKMQLADYYTYNGYLSIPIEGIRIGAAFAKNSHAALDIEMVSYTWETWTEPVFHERLKRSYYILKDTFKSLK